MIETIKPKAGPVWTLPSAFKTTPARWKNASNSPKCKAQLEVPIRVFNVPRESGVSFRTAAKELGVSQQTFLHWTKGCRKDESSAQ